MSENLFLHSFILSQCDLFYILILEVGQLVHLITVNYIHTHTLGTTSLDEGSTRQTDLYRKIHNIPKRQTSIHQAVLKPAITASEQLQTHSRL